MYFFIGASGSGKTTIGKMLEKKLPEWKILFFDSIGVPTIDEMYKNYTSPENWQRQKTIEWVSIIKKQLLPHTRVILDGQTRQSFIEEACKINTVTEYEIILFDCSDEERKKRLNNRGDQKLADENMMNWAKFLREDCQKRGFHILDTTHLDIEGTFCRVLEYLSP